METLRHDTRLALRSLVRTPAFFALTVVTLAVGVGAATTLFSVIDGVLLAPLPYVEPERLARVGEVSQGSERIYAMSFPDVFDLRERSRSFDGLAVSQGLRTTVRGAGEPEIVAGAMVSAGFFELLGVRPVLGRSFAQAEDEPGADPVALLSYGLWQRRWGGDRAILGQPVTLGSTSVTLVGVLPPGFHPPEALGQRDAEIWLPLSLLSEDLRNDRPNTFLRGIARLRPGVSLEAARSELTALGVELTKDFPEAGERRLGLSPLHRETVGHIGATLLPLFGAVGLLLLIACANVANLMLVRAGKRGREMALRTAIGAGRGHIVRQLLTESLVLGVFGGALGTAIASVGVRFFVALSPGDVPRLAEVGVNGRVLVFATAVSVLTSLTFGWLPAMRSSRPDLAAGLKGGVSGASPDREKLRNAMVVAETAVAFVLVVGAGLLLHSFVRLQRVEMGFDPEHVHVLGVSYPSGAMAEERSHFFDDLMERIAVLPGVTAVGATANLPLSGRDAMRRIVAVDEGPDVDEEGFPIYYQHVSAGFFEAMGIPRLRGRFFDTTDRPGSRPVAVVNDAMARALFGDADPLGRRFQLDGSDAAPGSWFEIVGVVADVRQHRLAQAGVPELYFSFGQNPAARRLDIVARTSASHAGMLSAMRSQLRAVRSDLPVLRSVRMEDFVADSIAAPRFYTVVLGSFAGVALLLALVGIYGTLAYAVAQRSHELGIRMALGASARSVLRMVLRRGMALVATGVALGVGGALLTTRVLQSFVFGITPTDGTTLALGVAAVLLAAFVACAVPAWHATKLDPIAVLKKP